MNSSIIYTIVRKELRETLRDKRTLVAMIVVPVLLYPMLIILAIQAATVQQNKVQEQVSQVAVSPEAARSLRQVLESIEKVQVVHVDDPEAALLRGDVDAVVTPQPDAEGQLAAHGTTEVRIAFDGTEMESQEALNRIERAFEKFASQILQDRLERIGLEQTFAKPINVVTDNMASAEKKAGSILGMTLPVMMIIMLGVGAFYPAVDLTAGEKERGTFETLLSTPTSKMEIVCGKFVTVLFLSLITGLLNLASMVISLSFSLSQANAGVAGGHLDLRTFEVSPLNVGLMLVLLVPLAFFICSVMMSVAVLARDFKEAQNFVTPFFILIMLPGLFAGIPGVELTAATMFMPIANVALLFKELLIGKGDIETFFGVLLCTGVYATGSLVVAVWLFQREDVILSEDRGFPLALRRSAFVPRSEPTFGMALLLFAAALLLLFYVGTYVQGRQIIIGMLITQWGLLAVPTVLVLWFVRVDLVQSLSLRRPRVGAIVAVPLMVAGLLVLIAQVQVWQERYVLQTPDSIIEAMQRLFADEADWSLGWMLLAFVVSPAVCEELLFRGAILSGLRTRLPAVATVLLVGLLFGLMHLSIYRLAATVLLGVVITYLVMRSGSIFVGMLYHLLHNGILVLSQTEGLPLSVRRLFDDGQKQGFGAIVLLSALALVLAGITILERSVRARHEK